jgi:hypothetical protein
MRNQILIILGTEDKNLAVMSVHSIDDGNTVKGSLPGTGEAAWSWHGRFHASNSEFDPSGTIFLYEFFIFIRKVYLNYSRQKKNDGRDSGI